MRLVLFKALSIQVELILSFQKLGPLLLDSLVSYYGHDFFNLFSQFQLVFHARKFERVLDHKVPVRVHDKVAKSLAIGQLAHDDLQVLWGRVLNAPVYYV